MTLFKECLTESGKPFVMAIETNAGACLVENNLGYKILKAEFTKEDIACIPTATDGKFRVHRCKIVGEVSLKKIGLEKTEKK